MSNELRVGSLESGVGAKAPPTLSDTRHPTRDPLISDPRSPTRDPRTRTLALAPLQEWMQAVVTHSGDVYEAAEAMTHVFEEAEVEPMPPDAIAAMPPERIEALRFTPIPALRLLTLASNANDVFQAFREERAVEPRRGKSWLAVHRRDYGVYRMPLS